MKLDFSVGIGRNLRMNEIGEHARVAEECGFSHVTFVDQQNLNPDVYVMMTLAAVSTHRIKIGQGVTQPYTYHPSVIANATASVDALCGGRAFLGLGAGGNAVRSMGLKAQPMRDFRECIEFIRRYSRGEEAVYKGARMHSEWVRRPFPIYVASAGPRSLQIAGELGDGVVFPGSHPVLVKWSMEQVEKGALRAGRDPSKIDTWVRTLVFVAESKEAARRESASYAANVTRLYDMLRRENEDVIDLRQRIDGALPGIIDEFKRVHDVWDEYEHEKTDAAHAGAVTDRVIDFRLITGTPDDVVERIHQLGKLGVKNVSCVMFSVVDKKGMMREIADKVMVHFRN